DVPPWMQDNYYILSGYRRPTNSIPSSLLTIFHLHNESGNIWSHLLASLAFLLVLTPVTYFSILPSILGAGVTADEVMMAPFLVGAVGCLGLSGTFHTLCCTSQEVAHAYNKLDYAGIILLIVGSFAPTLHYAFYCSPNTAHIYMGVQAVLGAVALYFTIAPHFATPHFRTFRATLFSALGLAGVVPVVHVLSLYGYALKGGSVAYLITMAVMYLTGAVLYAVRWPECWWPGRFDYWFHSHQIFHLLVVSAAVTHWLGAISAARWWHGGAIMGDGTVWEGFEVCAR
ncbi:putative hemolysin-III channel protein Izh2, partial [Gonapodya prolifera JEL478]